MRYRTDFASSGTSAKSLLEKDCCPALSLVPTLGNLLKCGLCGSNLIIASGGGKKPKYVCSGYFNRGICSNNLYIRQDELEERLLGRMRSELLEPDSINRHRTIQSSIALLT